LDASPIDFVPGDDTGISMPAHGEALRSAGAAWLTEAFRTFGSICATNRITRITRWERCAGGSTGQKFYLSVEYERPDQHLHGDLFVKFSRDFADKMRDDRGKYEMESEVRLAALSRLQSFPIRIPKPYFADFHAASKSGVLITQRIAFGVDGVEPHRPKCLDYEMPDALAHYQTILRALARIAAAHQSGRLCASIAERFPYDPNVAASAAPFGYDAAQLQALVQQYADFVARCPQLLPPALRRPEFIAALDRDTRRVLEHETTIKRFLQGNPNLIALCHWNAQIDNAWFWRDAAGDLQCGLLDWGHVNQMNVAFSLWGCLCGADLEIWEGHFAQLLGLFADQLHAHGGARIEVAELKRHVLLYMALMGVSYFMASPTRILLRLPEAIHASGPRDPMFRGNETARNNLHCLTIFLSVWEQQQVGRVLDDFLTLSGSARAPVNPGISSMEINQ
jgi:hypothetical protein